MKSTRIAIAALLFLAAPFGAIAQDQLIDGKAVPEGQLTAVKDRCLELQAQQGTTGTQEPETSMDPMAEEKTEQAAGGASEGMLDISAITLQQCIDGGFIEQDAAE